MEMVGSKNFLIKYLILELFEKLHRLRKYIRTCEKFDKKNNNDKIIDLFKSSIEIIGNEVDKLCSELSSDLSDNEKFAYILKISQNSRAIIKIHEELKNLHSSWILPEIKTFTNEIINKRSDLKSEINIILSDNYTFLESNLGKKFEFILHKAYTNSEYTTVISDNHSFILPKIEFSNPLNWTIIVHEAGHLQEDVIKKLRDNPDIMPDDISSSDLGIIKNWAEEIYCDIHAASCLGPAYFISFVSFALLSTMDFGISSHSEMHPSIIIRASIILNYLKDNELIFDPSWGIENYSNIFYQYLLEQNSVFNEVLKNPIKGLTKFNRNLRRSLKDLNLNTFSIAREDSIRIKTLIANLENGIPIGSIRKESQTDFKRIFETGVLSQEDLNLVKNSVSERSCNIWEILNAGWIYKLENCFNKGEIIFFSEISLGKNVIDKIDTYGEVIDFLDDRLLSSINTSQIVKIIEGH